MKTHRWTEAGTLALCIALFPPIWAVLAPYIGVTTGSVALITAGLYVAHGNSVRLALPITVGFLLGDLWAVLAVPTTLGPGNRPVKQEKPEQTFPGVLTEKYVRYETEDSYAKAKRLLVLVTPKAVELLEGDLVTVTEGPAAAVYNVQTRHVLDEYKNEYEIMYSRDI